jgi:hypothetical protein
LSLCKNPPFGISEKLSRSTPERHAMMHGIL